MLCGLLMGSFYWFVAWSMSKERCGWKAEAGPLHGLCFFAGGVLASNLIFNRFSWPGPSKGRPAELVRLFCRHGPSTSTGAGRAARFGPWA